MPFDGLIINALVDELKEKIVGGRVDKIHQPEKDGLIIHIRNKTGNHKMLVSADSKLAHVTLTELKKENPNTPPMFCMLLRKHLAGSIITDVTQVDFERIIKISVDSRNELGDTVTKDLIIEIMGKHSNIVLVEKASNKIIDSIKRIPFGTSRSRQLLPGLSYELPPIDKINPRTSTLEDYCGSLDRLDDTQLEEPAHKNIFMVFQGISPVVSRNVVLASGIDINMPIGSLDHDHRKLIWQEIQNMCQLIDQKEKDFFVVKDEYDITKDFSIMHLENLLAKEDYTEAISENASDAINLFFAKKEFSNRNMQKSLNLRKVVSGRINKLNRKLKNLAKDMNNAENAVEFKLWGDMIIANIYQIKKGDSVFKGINYYEENSPEIEIRLDIRLSPSDNAQVYYKKYNKSKTALIKVAEQIEKTEHEVDYLENVLVNLENSVESKNLEDIRQELVDEGYVKKRHKKKIRKKDKSQPFKYLSSDGMVILVGKNNTQNDELTLKTASKSDLWLHTKIIPGSHVIIRAEGQPVSDETLEEAAQLAALYSKAKTSDKVPVDYTAVRNVKKPNGAKPGMVIYETNNTIYVDPGKNKLTLQ